MTIYRVPKDLRDFLNQIKLELPKIIGTKLYGIYIYGSTSYGDFEEATSDVDLVVILKETFSSEELTRLGAFFTNRELTSSRWLRRTEIDFILLSAIKPVVFNEVEAVRFSDGRLKTGVVLHGVSIDLANIKICGITLHGPDPKIFVPEIERELSDKALKDKFDDLKKNAPSWMKLNLWNQAFIVIQLCRVIYTLKTQSSTSKKKASRWCLEELPRNFEPVIKEAIDKIDNYNNPLSGVLTKGIPELIIYTENLFANPL